MQIIEENGEIFVIEADGRKRRTEKHYCKECNAEYYRRPSYGSNRHYTFCSSECRYSCNNRIVKCRMCGIDCKKKTSQFQKSKHQVFFCSRKCKDEGQKTIKEIQPPHYGTSTKVDYRAKFNIEELKCSRCGYDEFKPSVQIHHVDEDRNNNDISNLIPLCANCHWALHSNCWSLNEISSVKRIS